MEKLTKDNEEQGVSQDSKLEAMRSLLADIKMIAAHGIPYYAFGDNEAACDMNHRLAEIYSLASNDQ